MYCENCGNKIEDDITFCPECGSSTNAKISEQTQISI